MNIHLSSAHIHPNRLSKNKAQHFLQTHNRDVRMNPPHLVRQMMQYLFEQCCEPRLGTYGGREALIFDRMVPKNPTMMYPVMYYGLDGRCNVMSLENNKRGEPVPQLVEIVARDTWNEVHFT